MLKKILLIVLAIIVVSIICEATALLHEKASLKSFATYWTSQNKTAHGTLTYVALGDSTAQGIGASKATNSYAGLLAARIAQKTGKQVRLINLSVSGAKINNVLTKQLPQLATYNPDLVTIEIGANNVVRYNADQFQTQFNDLVSRLPNGTYVSDMPYFGGRIRTNSQAIAANALIYKAIQNKDLHLVQLQKITKDRQSIRNYAADGFHPSNHGYMNWADAFWLQIEPDLASSSN